MSYPVPKWARLDETGFFYIIVFTSHWVVEPKCTKTRQFSVNVANIRSKSNMHLHLSTPVYWGDLRLALIFLTTSTRDVTTGPTSRGTRSGVNSMGHRSSKRTRVQERGGGQIRRSECWVCRIWLVDLQRGRCDTWGFLCPREYTTWLTTRDLLCEELWSREGMIQPRGFDHRGPLRALYSIYGSARYQRSWIGNKRTRWFNRRGIHDLAEKWTKAIWRREEYIED